MADPDLKVGWGGGGGGGEGGGKGCGGFLLPALPALFPSLISSFFPKNKRGPGLSPRSATADVTDEN